MFRKYIVAFLIIFSVFFANNSFASSVIDSQTDISGGEISIYFTTKAQTFTASEHYTATNLEIYAYTEGSLHLYLTDGSDTPLADCTNSSAGTDWKICAITPVELSTGITYKIKANGGDLPDASWKKGASGIQTYKIYGDIIATPTLKMITVATGTASTLLGYTTTLFSDLWVVIALVIGLPLAFYIIRKIISLVRTH